VPQTFLSAVSQVSNLPTALPHVPFDLSLADAPAPLTIAQTFWHGPSCPRHSVWISDPHPSDV